MSYEAALAFFKDPRWVGSKPGLERTRDLLSSLGNPEKKLKFVHVVGTNGKGSTSACVASCLKEAGYRTGLYTSPYVLRFNEMIQVDGEQIKDRELEELTLELAPHAEAMSDSPTEFELITALAFYHFFKSGCDIVVLEAGMGGELDATNVIGAPEAAVVCPIALDHCQWLGSSLKEIALVKGGIIKKGCDVAMFGSGAEADTVIEQKCAEAGAKLYKPDFNRLNIISTGINGCFFDYERLKNVFLPLSGAYQPKNAALAITVLDLLKNRGWKISDKAIKSGLSKVYWPGRYEVLGSNPTFILDGSHNPHGMEATADSLKKHFGGRKLTFLVGVMADKDIPAMMSFIAPMAERFIAVEPPNPRAMKPQELAKLLYRLYGRPSFFYDSIAEGVKAAVAAAGPSGVVVALGSLYFSGEVRAAVNELSSDIVKIQVPALTY
jgi:dihydrofolate synthase/folylpolyglutamate synthase